MSVYHCPLCPLIFQYRTEVEWHLREEHRSRTDEEADLRAELAAAAGSLDWDRLQALRSSTAGPSVSLLLATTPASSMTVLDIARLRQLADRARRRLPAEPDRGTTAPTVAHRVAKAVAAAEGSPTDRGLAVMVNPNQLAMVTLPFEPRDRAVVDRAFTTRDLEYALRRYPIYRVLVLGHRPRLLEGRGRNLADIDAPRPETHGARNVFGRSDTELQAADRLLDWRSSASGDLPLIVIGDRRRLAAFRRDSRHAPTVAGVAHRARTGGPPVDELAERALTGWHHDRQGQTVAALSQAETLDQVTWGIVATWHAVATKIAERIWVEHDFAQPGRIVSGVEGVETSIDPAEPGAVDDLVDWLIAKASQEGIPVDLLDKGTLRRGEPIAAKVPSPNRNSHSDPRVLTTT